MRKVGAEYAVTISGRARRASRAARAHRDRRAHGSWERAPVAGRSAAPTRASDFDRLQGAPTRELAWPPGLMPLVLFPGGYGGMVHGDGGARELLLLHPPRRAAPMPRRAPRPGRRRGGDRTRRRDLPRRARGARGSASRSGVVVGRPDSARRASARARRPLRDRQHGGRSAPRVAGRHQHGDPVGTGFSAGTSRGEGALSNAALESGREERYRQSWQRHFSTRVRASSLFASLPDVPRRRGSRACSCGAQLPVMPTWGAWWSGKAHALHAAEASA